MKIVSFSCFVAVFLAIAFLSGCVAPTTARVDTDLKSSSSRPLAILLVGNSFSFGVPKELKRLAVRQGLSVTVEQVTHSGWSLAQHAKCDGTLRRIRDRHWDVVILQEQSRIPSQPVKRTFRMLPAVRQLANLARAHGAEAVLYQTWGYRDGDSFRKNDDFIKMTARIRDGYHEAASHAGDLRVLPVGDAWENAMSNGDGWDLFQADGMHPSRRGNQLTAAVIFRELFPSQESQALGIKQMPAAASANFSGSP